MRRILILTAVFFLSVVMISCGGEDISENFPNEHDGLNWSDASSSDKTWDEAVTYCEDLCGRLPTISELRTLIQNCPATETGGECGVTDDCPSWDDCWNSPCKGCEYDETNPGKYSVFGDNSWFWSSSEPSANTDGAWSVHFYDGYVDLYYKNNYNVIVRCVR